MRVSNFVIFLVQLVDVAQIMVKIDICFVVFPFGFIVQSCKICGA